MPRVCKICIHPKRLVLDRELIQGRSKIEISRKYNVPYHSLVGHERDHLSHQLTTAYRQKELAESMDLMGEIDSMIDKCKSIFDRNYASGKDPIALKALDSQRGVFELLCKISESLHQARLLELREKESDLIPAAQGLLVEQASEILSAQELNVFHQLMEKIESGDNTQPVDLIVVGTGYNSPSDGETLDKPPLNTLEAKNDPFPSQDMAEWEKVPENGHMDGNIDVQPSKKRMWRSDDPHKPKQKEETAPEFMNRYRKVGIGAFFGEE